MINKKFLRLFAKNMYVKISKTYYQTKKFIQKTEFLPEESLKALQFRLLKDVLINAYEKVPYYGETFGKAGLDPNEIDRPEDIHEYPLLTKDQYRQNVDRFLSKGVSNALLVKVYTGGTTGTPVPLYRSLNDFARDQAYNDSCYHMLGMDPYCKTVYIRGEVDDKRGRFHYVGNFGKTLYLSSHNMSDKSLEEYIKLIRDFKPQLLYSLPSIATGLAEFMERKNVSPFNGLRWVFTPSENLYDFQKKLMEKVFRCRVGTFYGHSEHAVKAGLCSKSSMYHVFPQYGYVELIDEKGRPITEEGKLGEIVGTSFTNTFCPLIRYRTGDYAVYTKRKCSCGRNYQMWEKIVGRGQSIAISKDGGRISIGPDLLCTIYDNTYGKIKQFRIEQQKIGELIFHVALHNISDIMEIREFFEGVFDEQFPGCFDVEVKLEEDLNNGEKHLYFIQKIERMGEPTYGMSESEQVLSQIGRSSLP